MSKKYDVVLLDLDGTVADSDEMIVQSMNTLYDLYRKGIKTPREKIYYFSGPPIRETLKNEFPDMDVEFMFNEFVRVSWDNYDKYVITFPGVIETLTKLKEEGIKLGIVTTKARPSSIHCLDILKLNGLIDYLVTSDDVKEIKPNPEGIYQSMEHFSILNKKKVLYIGDNKSDYLTGRNAGVDVALVTWGHRTINRELTPDYWLDEFKQLEEIVHGKDL